MPRYFTRPRALLVGDDDVWPVDIAGHIPSVSDHHATNTGILDANGDPIMRAPRPIGFGRDEDW